MKKFHFSLERVRQWRDKQVALEASRLERLFAEKVSIEDQRRHLEAEALESATAVKTARSITAAELARADDFNRYVISQRPVLAAKLGNCESRIVQQQRTVMEARRQFELLEKLKNTQWQKWNTELSREIETQAGEAFLAKWSRQHQG